MVFSGTGRREAAKEYIEQIDAEGECEVAVLFVHVDVAGVKGEEASDAVAVLEDIVLVLWFGESGGVGGKFCDVVGGRGAFLMASNVEYRGGVGREKLMGRETVDDGGR